MSRFFGEIRQLGYVVNDIEAAMRHWIDVLGVGPWYYVDRLPVRNFRYRGQPSDPHVSIALANSGGAQIELIQQRDDAPSMYRDFLASGREGLQHVSTWPLPEAYDRIVADCQRKGIPVGQSGESNRGPFAYFATDVFPGTCMEIAAMTDLRRRQFEAIAKAAVDWDGSDPIRTRWPD